MSQGHLFLNMFQALATIQTKRRRMSNMKKGAQLEVSMTSQGDKSRRQSVATSVA